MRPEHIAKSRSTIPNLVECPKLPSGGHAFRWCDGSVGRQNRFDRVQRQKYDERQHRSGPILASPISGTSAYLPTLLRNSSGANGCQIFRGKTDSVARPLLIGGSGFPVGASPNQLGLVPASPDVEIVFVQDVP